MLSTHLGRFWTRDACWDLNFLFFPSAQHSHSEPEALRPGTADVCVLSHPSYESAARQTWTVLSTWVQAIMGKTGRRDFLFSHRALFQYSVLVYKTTPKLSGSKCHFVFLMAG